MSQPVVSAPDWYRLLKFQRETGKTGLTIPFLVGASIHSQALPEDENQVFGQLSGLILSLRDETPAEHVVVISECTELREPIAALYSAGHKQDGCDGVVPMSGKTRLFVQRKYFESRERTVDSAVDRLWKMLGEHVVDRRFSFRDGSYAPFSSVDLAFLEKARAPRRPDPPGWSRWKSRPS